MRVYSLIIMMMVLFSLIDVHHNIVIAMYLCMQCGIATNHGYPGNLNLTCQFKLLLALVISAW